MKQLIISYLATVLLLTTIGCTQDVIEAPTYDDTDGKVTFRVGLNIADAQPLAARAILEDVPERPDGTYLEALKYYLFVFEDNGSPQTNYLRELVYGSDIRDIVVEDSHDHTYTRDKALLKFTVRLDGTAENAIIHIVATDDPNFEDQLRSVPDRSEFGIFTGANGLYTSSKEAYWRRIELDQPITSANKEVVQTQLSHVNMVRNVSRVTLKISENTEDVMNFVPEAFVVVNSIDLGYVAAYNENLGNDNQPGFVDFEAKAETEPYGYLGTQRTYRDLTDTEQYVPSRHPASNRQYADDNTTWMTAFEGESSDNNPESNMLSKYMFERSVQNDHKTFVVVKGRFSPNENPTYIKLDIGTIDPNSIDADTQEPFGVFETYNMIRNFSYDITITHIRSTSAGHASVEGAVGAPPANNISTSIETRPLTEIHDGVDMMEVNQTTVVIVDQDGEDGTLLPNPQSFTMMWRYEEDYYKEQTPKIYRSESVKWNYPGYAFTFEGGKDPDGIIKSWVGASGVESTTTPVNQYTTANPNAQNDSKAYDDNWRGFVLNFETPDNVTREKTIRLYQPNGLTRDVTFISHKRWEFVDSRPEDDKVNVEVYPGSYSYEPGGFMPWESLNEMREALNYDDDDSLVGGEGYVGSQRGAQLTVLFELPADLPEAIFPLDFKIGFDRQNAENAYVGNAVATWGTSLFEDDPGGVGVMRIQFIKTVTWDYYQQHRIVCARFLTTTDVFADADDTPVTPGQDVVATTRVRITNPYFKPGNDTFKRSSHDDTMDPTRTRWHWNFTYPEWLNYFQQYSSGSAEDPHNLNNLNFKDYGRGSTSGYGNYIAVGPAGPEDPDATENDPDIWFPVQFSMDDYTGGTLTIRASVDKGRDNMRVTGTGFFGTANRWGYDLYDRDLYAAVVGENGQVYILEPTRSTDYNDSTHYHLTQTSSGNTNDGTPRNPEDWTFSLVNVPAGVKITEVRIWTVHTDTFSTSNYDYVLKNGRARYYDILFTLTPKPNN